MRSRCVSWHSASRGLTARVNARTLVLAVAALFVALGGAVLGPRRAARAQQAGGAPEEPEQRESTELLDMRQQLPADLLLVGFRERGDFGKRAFEHLYHAATITS